MLNFIKNNKSNIDNITLNVKLQKNYDDKDLLS